MIAGVGTDIVDCARVRKALAAATAERLIATVLSEPERALFRDRKVAGGEFFAGRWAAKEAVAKALGTGMGRQCSYDGICVLNDEAGAPKVELTGPALAAAQALAVTKIHLSISHERAFAVAFAVLEA